MGVTMKHASAGQTEIQTIDGSFALRVSIGPKPLSV